MMGSAIFWRCDFLLQGQHGGTDRKKLDYMRLPRMAAFVNINTHDALSFSRARFSLLLLK